MSPHSSLLDAVTFHPREGDLVLPLLLCCPQALRALACIGFCLQASHPTRPADLTYTQWGCAMCRLPKMFSRKWGDSLFCSLVSHFASQAPKQDCICQNHTTPAFCNRRSLYGWGSDLSPGVGLGRHCPSSCLSTSVPQGPLLKLPPAFLIPVGK